MKKLLEPEQSQSSQSSDEIFNLYAVIPMNGLTLLYVKLRFSPQVLFKALIDTGGCANVILKQTFYKLRQNKDIEKILHIKCTTLSTVKMASGQIVSLDAEVSLPSKLGNQCFNEKFLVLKSANSMILRSLLFKKHNIQLCPKNILLQFPGLTIRVNLIKETEHENQKTKKLTRQKSQFYFQKIHLQTRKISIT